MLKIDAHYLVFKLIILTGIHTQTDTHRRDRNDYNTRGYSFAGTQCNELLSSSNSILLCWL